MKFVIGLLLGILLGTAGTAAFLITAGGGDYLIVSSPRVRELETSLRQSEREREGLAKRVDEFASHMAKLESRFISLGARFEGLAGTPGKGAAPGSDSLPERADSPGAGADGAAARTAGSTADAGVPEPVGTPAH